MKKYLIMLIVLLSTFMVGCMGDSAVLKDGKKALEDHKYDEAKTYLSDVLELDPENESARAMYMQALNMSKAEAYKDKGLYDKALECLEKIVNIGHGSKKIKVESNSLKKQLEDLKRENDESANIRKENAKDSAAQAHKKAEQEFYIWRHNQNKKPQQSDEDKEQTEDGDSSLKEEIKDNIKDVIENLTR